jgi:hypothetical protein
LRPNDLASFPRDIGVPGALRGHRPRRSLGLRLERQRQEGAAIARDLAPGVQPVVGAVAAVRAGDVGVALVVGVTVAALAVVDEQNATIGIIAISRKMGSGILSEIVNLLSH